jgi:acetolactate synthase-1/3 small subunit/acetolactate synthase II small subunit
MNRTIEVGLTQAEGAIVRTLGLIERRGFVVNGVETLADPLGGALVLRVEVGSRGRPFDVLVRQILRLFDVRHACLVEAQAQAGRRLVC